MEKGYSIKTAAQIAGLTPYTLRGWEQRYKVVTPSRTKGNQRVYSDADLKRLVLLSRCVAAGHRISHLARLNEPELEELLQAAEPQTEADTSVTEYLDRSLAALSRLSAPEVEDLLSRAFIELGPLEAIDRVIVPLMEELGRGWHAGRWRISHEHLASTVVRAILGSQLRSVGTDDGELQLLVTTPAGQFHELGALACALAAATAGFSVLYLGPNVPATEIVHAAEVSGASVVLLSVVFPGGSARVRGEFETLRRYLPANCRLIAGGPSARSLGAREDELLPSGGVNELFTRLVEIRKVLSSRTEVRLIKKKPPQPGRP